MRGRVCDSRAPHSARPTSPSFGGSSRSRGSTRWCWGWSRRDVLGAHGFSPLRSSPPEWLQLSSIGIASHGDDDFSLSVSLFQITDGVGDLAQRVSSVDDRCDFPASRNSFKTAIESLLHVLESTSCSASSIFVHARC